MHRRRPTITVQLLSADFLSNTKSGLLVSGARRSMVITTVGRGGCGYRRKVDERCSVVNVLLHPGESWSSQRPGYTASIAATFHLGRHGSTQAWKCNRIHQVGNRRAGSSAKRQPRTRLLPRRRDTVLASSYPCIRTVWKFAERREAASGA